MCAEIAVWAHCSPQDASRGTMSLRPPGTFAHVSAFGMGSGEVGYTHISWQECIF